LQRSATAGVAAKAVPVNNSAAPIGFAFVISRSILPMTTTYSLRENESMKWVLAEPAGQTVK
jgi:hypothetical protein